MIKTKYGKYISNDIIEESPYSQVTAPMIRYRGYRGRKDITFELSCITNPFTMDDEPEVNQFDQFLLFMGSDFNDYSRFEAEIEISLGKEGEKQSFNEPRFLYIPQGLVHGPVKFKSVRKPVTFVNICLSPELSVPWDSQEYGKYLVKPEIMAMVGETVSYAGPTPFRYQKTFQPSIGVSCDKFGLKGNFNTGFFTVKSPYIAPEPVHFHKNFDEWLLFLGSNPLNVEEFDAEAEMWWGEERERERIDLPSICYVPKGLIHRSTDFRIINKPVVHVIITAVNKYFKEMNPDGTFPEVLSREENGDIMISKGQMI
jgi:hypothetical protein